MRNPKQSDLQRNIRRAPSSNRVMNGVSKQANGNGIAQNGEPKVKILKPAVTATSATASGSRSGPASPERLSSRMHFSSAQNSPFTSPCPSPRRTTSPSPSPSPIAVSTGGISILKPSTMRPGTSLLRRNAVITAQTPPAAVSISKPVPVSPKSDLEKTVPEVNVDFWSRVMGRSPEDTQAEIENRIAKRGIHLLKKYSEYHKFLSERLFRLNASTFSTPDKCIFYIVRYLPLVTPMAKDSMYRTVHPYAAKSTKEFRSWNVGKQLAAEFLRARTIRRLVENLPALKVHLKPDRYIVRLLREHGYTIPFHGQCPPSNSAPPVAKLAAPLPASSYLTNMADIESALSRGKKEHALFTDIEIDVVSVDDKTGSGVKVKSEPTEFRERATSRTVLKEERSGKDNDGGENDAEKPKQRRACLMLPEDDPAVFTFVAATAKQIGIKMGPQEELAPGVFYPAAQKLLVRACKTMCESLIRKSHRAAFLRNGGAPPSAGISPVDVFEAIDSEQDLDIFSNKGLGAEIIPSSEDLDKMPKTWSMSTKIKEEQK